MPIYEYECTSCGHTFEEWQRDFKEREINCPECGGKAKRLISNTSFILKGSGWYVTDYARPKNSGNGNGKKNGKTETKASEPPKSKSVSSSTQSTKNS